MKRSKAEKLARIQAEEPPRRAIFAIKPDIFLAFFNGTHKYTVSENAIPRDAKVIDVRLERWKGGDGVIEVLIEHPTIPPLVEGQPVPYIKPPKLEDPKV